MSRLRNLNIFLTGPVNAAQMGEITAITPDATVRHFADQAALEAEISQAEIVVTTDLSAQCLNVATRLKWVQSWAAGPNALPLSELKARHITVTSCKGNGAIPLAEHAVMLMLLLDRDFPRTRSAQSNRKWDRFPHSELNNRTCGIIGTGHSGQDLAAKLKAFHMRTLGLRRGTAVPPEFDQMYRRDELHSFLAQCDFVVVTAPLTAETRGMLDADAFGAMKPECFFICVSRGGIADDDALLAALHSGQIAGAGLDAHTLEPLPADSPFWLLNNVVVTPHHGAVTAATRQRGFEIFADNLDRFINGRALRNEVDLEAGY